METYGKKAQDIINYLYTERLSYHSEYLPLINAADKLVDYEGLRKSPEELAADLARLADLDKQIAEGLRPLLPCKVGDILYVQCLSEVMETKVTSIQILSDITIIVTGNKNEHAIWNTHAFALSNIGKTVFLTRDAAEAKGQNNG